MENQLDGKPTQKKPNFIDPTAVIVGRLMLGEQDYIGPFAKVEAGSTFSIRLSDEVNLQDNVCICAASQNVVIGERTSIAHGARVIDSNVGNFVFVGFNACLEHAILEDGVMVQHGARVSGVSIPKGRVVPPGAVITSAAQVGELAAVSEAHELFKEEVVAVNNEFAAGYTHMVLEFGKISVMGVGPGPRTSWNLEPTAPLLGKGACLSQDTRVIGGVELGEKCSLGSQTSIRADEGNPIRIGAGAKIGNGVTFHALKEQAIRIGDQLTSGDRVVFHGELSVGDQVSVGSDAVLFKAMIGSGVTIGEGAIVIGVCLANGACVPDGARVLDQAAADKLAPTKIVVFPVKISITQKSSQ